VTFSDGLSVFGSIVDALGPSCFCPEEGSGALKYEVGSKILGAYLVVLGKSLWRTALED
jgi:hypothetical protein